jgi:RecA-family ATPase
MGITFSSSDNRNQVPSLNSLQRALGGKISKGQLHAPGPGHSRKDRSMVITTGPEYPDGFLVKTFSPKDDPLAAKDYIRDRAGLPRWEPKRKSHSTIRPRLSTKPPKPPTPATEYIYQTADGEPYLKIKRTEDKGFPQFHWTGTAWESGVPPGPKIPYRLPELLAAEHDTVLICEGEKDADNVAALGFTATTASGGSNGWTEDLNQHFKGRDVYILPDNDDAGEIYAKSIFENLSGIARSIRVVRLPDLDEGEDVSDWIAAGGTADALAELLRAAPKAQGLVVSSGDFIADFEPPDYLIDGLVQRRFIYSLTAPTGSGKTAVALLMCANVALGRGVGEYSVERGRVLYLAGENPDDIRMRWLAMADAMKFDIDKIDVHFLPGALKLSEFIPRIRSEIEKIGDIALLVVDTSAAYFEGVDENANVPMHDHARRLRTLVTMPGGPTVLVACHPIKNADTNSLQPRGGGAFIAEMDGNLTLSKSDAVVTLHWQGKFRGPDFEPIPFQLATATTERLKDTKGRKIPTVVATAMSERELKEAETATYGDEDAMLIAMSNHDQSTLAGLADLLQWTKSKAQRCANRLRKSGHLKAERRFMTLTDKGKKEAARVKVNANLAGAKYG